LESPWVKRPVAVGGIISVTWEIIGHLHSVGLLAKEDAGPLTEKKNDVGSS
jgi:hypothetical protein